MKKYWLLALLPVLLLLWWGVGHSESAPTIHFSTVAYTTVESTVPTNGKVEPAESAVARAETAGTVQAVDVQRGESVRVGQPLITLDTTSASSELAAAIAREQQAQAELSALNQGGKASLRASANDAVASAQATADSAQRNYDSLVRLEKLQAATQLQVQAARDALDRAKLELSAAQDQRRTLVTGSDKQVAQAKLHDAQAAVELARHRLSQGAVRAPIAGAVYEFNLKVGAYLNPGDEVAKIGDVDNVKVVVYVDEPDLGRVAKGMPVSITWDAHPGQKWWGQVDRLPTEVTALETRTVGEVDTVVSNPNHDLLPGVTVNATIVSKVAKNALSIPKAALRTMHGSSGVYKLVDKSLVWTPVQTGISDINNVQILSGLNQGDKVADRVVEPSDAEIKDGMRVRPVFD